MRADVIARQLLTLAAAFALNGCAGHNILQPLTGAPPNTSSIMKWSDLLTRPKPTPDATIAYGSDPLQVADLWLPAGSGPHPTVLMVHGGCWTSRIADRTIMNWLSNDLRTRGIAVWNIDYRGVDRPGGGYPGTYLDVSAATDALYKNAARYKLNLRRLVAVGHSAGGHLALWLAGRHHIAKHSILRGHPSKIRTVISLGGLPDLEQDAKPPGSGCGLKVIPKISGGLVAETSVPRLAPLGVRQVLVNSAQDQIVPVEFARNYAAAMRGRGDNVTIRMIDHSGHVELITPDTPAWLIAVSEIEAALRR